MPYRGKSVSILEMLEVLATNSRTETQAGLELERAFEEKAVRLFAPPNSASEPWRELSIDETKGVISLLRDIINRAPTKTIATWNYLPIDLFKAVRAIRAQFERECELVSVKPTPVEATAPMERKDAVRACMESGMIPAKTATWDVFCGKVRDLADGWKDKRNGTLKRGFDERTIKRDVTEILN